MPTRHTPYDAPEATFDVGARSAGAREPGGDPRAPTARGVAAWALWLDALPPKRRAVLDTLAQRAGKGGPAV